MKVGGSMSNYKMVFESFFRIPSYFYVFIVMLFLIILYLSKRYRKTAKTNFRIYYAVMIVFLFLQEFALFDNIAIRRTIESAMGEKTYSVVTGEINQYNPPSKYGNRPASFKIDNIFFKAYLKEITGSKESLFYTVSDNKVLYKDGQKVKIYYIKYLGENKIIKMWVEKEAAKNL